MRRFFQTFENTKISRRCLWRVATCDTTNSISSGRCNLNHESSLDLLPPRPRVRSSFIRHFGSRPDPFARRPTSKCDPYGQSGKPLTLGTATTLLRTVEPEWNILLREEDNGDEHDGEEKSGDVDFDGDENNSGSGCDDNDDTFVPFAIARDFWHEDYMHGAQFLTHVAAVAQMNAQHFPHQVVMERKLQSRTKSWKICTRVVCRTHVLQGLSHHDFYLATLIDIEMERPEIRGLLCNK